MVYNYQKDTLEHLKKTRKQLEKLTQEQKKLKIGTVFDEWINLTGTGYYDETRDLYLCLNHNNGFVDSTFLAEGEFDSQYGEPDGFIEFEDDLFLKINKFIDELFQSKKQREEFHLELNKQLKTINKRLENK